jgi:hypothetical protein
LNDVRTFAVILVWLATAVAAAGQGTAGGKDSRTPAQRKIDSQLLQEIDRLKSAPEEGPRTAVKIDRKQRALVDVRVEVTPAIQKSIRGLGGAIVSASSEYRSVVAWVPLLKLEALAADPSIRAIAPAPQAMIHR